MRYSSQFLLLATFYAAYILAEVTCAQWRPMGRFGKRDELDSQSSDWIGHKETRGWRPQGRFGRRKKADDSTNSEFIDSKEIRGWRPQGRFGKRTMTEDSSSTDDWIQPKLDDKVITSGEESIDLTESSRRTLEDINVPIFHIHDAFCVHLGKKGLYKCVRWHKASEKKEEK